VSGEQKALQGTAAIAANGRVDRNVMQQPTRREIFRPFLGTAYWFVESAWSDWHPFFLWLPMRLAGKWCWLTIIERRTCMLATEYRMQHNVQAQPTAKSAAF